MPYAEPLGITEGYHSPYYTEVRVMHRLREPRHFCEIVEGPALGCCDQWKLTMIACTEPPAVPARCAEVRRRDSGPRCTGERISFNKALCDIEWDDLGQGRRRQEAQPQRHSADGVSPGCRSPFSGIYSLILVATMVFLQ